MNAQKTAISIPEDPVIHTDAFSRQWGISGSRHVSPYDAGEIC